MHIYPEFIRSIVEIIILLVAISTILFVIKLSLLEEAKKLLSSKAILISVALLVLTKVILSIHFSYSLPVRKNALETFSAFNTKFYLFDTNMFAWSVELMMETFFTGLISYQIIKLTKGNPSNIWEALKKINFWFPRTLFGMIIGNLGVFAIGIISSNIFDLIFFPLMFIWNLFTYSIVLSVLEKNCSFFSGIKNAFVNGINNFSNWWKLLLIQSILLGGITIAWLPKSFAYIIPKLLVENIFIGFFLQWLGGYYANFRWTNEMFHLAEIKPSIITIYFISFSVVSLAVTIKLRIAKDL